MKKKLVKTKNTQYDDLFGSAAGAGVRHHQYCYPQAVHAQGSESGEEQVPL